MSNGAQGGSPGGRTSERRSRSVERAFSVLFAVADQHAPVGVSEIARLTGLPKSTVHLSLRTMHHLGMVEQDVGTERYVLGLRALQLGADAVDGSSLVAALSPAMKDLADRSSEAVSLAVRSDRSVVFVARFDTPQRLGTTIRVGTSMPLHASASGKCLLAGMADDEIRTIYPGEELPEQSSRTIRDRAALLTEIATVRDRGYADNHDEFLDGISAAAMPVELGGRVVAAVSIAGPTSRFRAGDWLDELRAITDPGARGGDGLPPIAPSDATDVTGLPGAARLGDPTDQEATA